MQLEIINTTDITCVIFYVKSRGKGTENQEKEKSQGQRMVTRESTAKMIKLYVRHL